MFDLSLVQLKQVMSGRVRSGDETTEVLGDERMD
jgi:hypothetical protein